MTNNRSRQGSLGLILVLVACAVLLFPIRGYAAESSRGTTLSIVVPEKPNAQVQAPTDAETLKDITLTDGWSWKDQTIKIQPGRTIKVSAMYKEGAEMEIEVTGKLAILTTGTDSEYTIGSDGGASIHCNGVLDALVSVEMDGKTVDASNYDKKDGSTIITFKKSYLDTLTVGTHTVTLNYEAGSVESKLEVKRAAQSTNATTGTTSGTGTTAGAQTGDTTNVAVFALLAVTSLLVCIIVFMKKKRI